jgi:hypothetical protein
MNQPSPPRSPSGRKSYTPNHPHSLDSHNGSSRCARLIQHPRKSRLRFLEKHDWPMVEIGNSAMKHACERAQVICAPITMRSAIPRPHLASQGWHCQDSLAQGGFSPLMIGTAKILWRGAGSRHPALALPGISGQKPLRVGSARIFWRGAGPRQPGLALPGFRGAGRVLASPPHTSF